MLDKTAFHNNMDSAISYGTGGFAFIVGSLPQVADIAQHIAIILGCIVVFFRVLYDGTRTIRYIARVFKRSADD